MTQNPLKPTKYTGPDQYAVVSANDPHQYSNPTDNKNPRTGYFWPPSSLCVNETTGTPWIFNGEAWVQLELSPKTGGTAATKGTFTLTAGSSGAIATTAVLPGSVIAVNVHTLGTVTAASAFLTTITSGTSFVITASQGTDTSSGTWAIVG